MIARTSTPSVASSWAPTTRQKRSRTPRSAPTKVTSRSRTASRATTIAMAATNAWAIGRGAMPDGRALQTHVVAEKDRVASISVWDGTITESGRPVDFTSADFFRVEDGLAAEHWDTVDYVRLYQSFGLLPDDINDV